MVRINQNFLWSVCLFLLCACTSEDNLQNSFLERTATIRLSISGETSDVFSHIESKISIIQGFRFEDGVLEECYDHLLPDETGTFRLQPSQMRGTVYFLANASDIVAKAGFKLGITTLDDFLSLKAMSDEMTSEGLVMAGKTELDEGKKSLSVILKRSVSRIDLDSSFEGVQVNEILIKGISPNGYVNEREMNATVKEGEVIDLWKDFGKQPFENGRTMLFYVCEQEGAKYEVEIQMNIQGAWHRLKTTLPEIKRNSIYTLKVYGNGTDIQVKVLSENWDVGSSSSSENQLKGIIDTAASQLSEGVVINERCDTVFVPYWKSDFQLAVLAEEDAEVVIDGWIDGVNVSVHNSRSLNQVSKVYVTSRQKMPGSVQEYMYLNVRRQSVYTGRVVLVFTPNPVTILGRIKFDENGECDFDGYVDGVLGKMMLPEGKEVELKFNEQEAKWMKLDWEDDRTCRLLGGWKPNDPLADGREQIAELIVSDIDGTHREVYTIKRRNWGLPVVNMNGVWWCKYNLRGNVKDFSDQILISDDPASNENLGDYLEKCSDEEFLWILGDQYQAGNQQGLELTHDGTEFYYRGFSNSTDNFGTMDAAMMAPEGYQIPDYNHFRFFTWGNNCNLGYKEDGFNNQLGQRLNFKIIERTIAFNGLNYGPVTFYDFSYEGNHWILCGLGHQADTNKKIYNMMILLATYGNANSTWMMEGYSRADGRGNWFKYANHNAQKTRTIRCIKTPVEYIYE